LFRYFLFPSFLCLLAASIFLPAAGASDAPHPWTVDKAVAYALENSPDSRITLERIAAARAEEARARAAFFPRLTLSAEYSQTDNPMYSFGNILNQGSFTPDIDFNDPGVTDNLRLAATLSFRLYNGGRDRAALEVARAGKEARLYSRTAVLSELSFAVVRSFYTIAQARENLAARRSALDAISSSLAVARARYRAGDLLKTGLLDIEVRQAAAKEGLIEARHGLELARRGFLNLLGLKNQEIRIDPTGPTSRQQVPNQSADGRQRPELRQLDAAIRAASARLKRARGGHLPAADLFGNLQMDQGYRLETNSGESWMAGIRISYDLYHGGLTEAEIARASAELARAREERKKMELAIALEIEQARLALRQAGERRQVTEKMVELARESARLSRQRFKKGVILASDLMDAENRLTEARVHLALARANQAIAVADLRRAVGMPQFADSWPRPVETDSSRHSQTVPVPQ